MVNSGRINSCGIDQFYFGIGIEQLGIGNGIDEEFLIFQGIEHLCNVAEWRSFGFEMRTLQFQIPQFTPNLFLYFYHYC